MDKIILTLKCIISILALAGGRSLAIDANGSADVISILALAGGRSFANAETNQTFDISILALAGGRSAVKRLHGPANKYFNSRPRGRAVESTQTSSAGGATFQFSPSREGGPVHHSGV